MKNNYYKKRSCVAFGDRVISIILVVLIVIVLTFYNIFLYVVSVILLPISLFAANFLVYWST